MKQFLLITGIVLTVLGLGCLLLDYQQWYLLTIAGLISTTMANLI